MRISAISSVLGLAAAGAVAVFAAGPVAAQSESGIAIPDYVPPPIAQMKGQTLRSYSAVEADQGVAVDREYFYAIDNSMIGKYRRSDGAFVARWTGKNGGLIAHLNSCYAANERLVCANSNYPALPMGSSIEQFDTARMAHIESRSLGLMDEGSLVWLLPHSEGGADGWMAGFAHYDRNDGRGGTGFKDARYGNVVMLDAGFRRNGGWLFPASVQDSMRPYAASGGAIGPDGLLYVLGHDRPEFYVLAKPLMGPTLIHIATIAADAPGQAFAFVPGGGRQVMAIDKRDRSNRRVNLIELPKVTIPEGADAAPFR